MLNAKARASVGSSFTRKWPGAATKNKMRLASFFTSIGGFDFGFELAYVNFKKQGRSGLVE